MFLPKNIQYVYIMSKQKETSTYIFLVFFPPPYCFVVFFKQQQSVPFPTTNQQLHQPTTPPPQQTPGRRGLHRGGGETEPGGLGGSACAALEGMTDVTTTDDFDDVFVCEKKTGAEKFLGWKVKAPVSCRMVVFFFYWKMWMEFHC